MNDDTMKAEALGRLKAEADAAFNAMTREWLIGGIGRMMSGGGGWALRNGERWGNTWARLMREVAAAEIELYGMLPATSEWWDEQLGVRGSRRLPLTRRFVAESKRAAVGSWAI